MNWRKVIGHSMTTIPLLGSVGFIFYLIPDLFYVLLLIGGMFLWMGIGFHFLDRG